ncbi:MAG: 3TM-type holin [Pigmentiphaga sp.]
MSVSAVAIPIILDVARRVGAPVIESIMRKALGDKAGGVAGDLAGKVIEAIAGKAGLDTDELGELSSGELEQAVRDFEVDAPQLILAQVEQQREANRLQLAEMEKDGTWTWAWRPATMWGLLAGWLWFLAGVPLINLFLALFGASMHVVLTVDAGTWMTVTGVYAGLYMGGHTIKSGVDKVTEIWRKT